MSQNRKYIAVDLGAESGRVMIGTVDENKLSLAECHRFGNGPLEQDGRLHWDFEKLFSEIKIGIAKAVEETDGNVCGIGVDSWGVDFGLVDDEGRLIDHPYHYRDSRTNGMLEKAFGLMPRRQIYNHTGIQLIQINSLYQLLAMRIHNPQTLGRAGNLLFIADLVTHHLCGKVFSEYSLASTSQLMDMKTGQWAEEIFDKLQLPLEIMPEIIKPGTVVGQLKKEIVEHLHCEPIPVIAVGSHDTASAVAGVPAANEKWAYLSSGTWSLMGVEIPQVIITDDTFEYQFTNEGGVENTIRLLKNIIGLWLVQECRREWLTAGEELSYSRLTQMAQKAQPFAGFINVDYHEFLSPGEMPAKINRFLGQTGQKTTDDKGRIIRLILENLAFKYRWVLDKLQKIMGRDIEVLHIVGGGIQNELLCQFAANATGKKVIAGPIEATAAGNIIMQAKACGQITSLSHGREIIGNSYELKQYLPENRGIWDEQYQKFTEMQSALATDG